MRRGKEFSRTRRGSDRRRLLALPLLAAGAWIAYSKLFVDHEQPLPEAMIAKRVVFRSKLGINLNYYVDKQAEGWPLLLIHGVNSAASAFEVNPLFEHYRGSRPVYALELPGFGFSDRPKREYTPAYFAEALLDFLETQIEGTADVLALSLSCEFAARAALSMPDLFHSLVFISPTGLGDGPGGATLQVIKPGSAAEMVYEILGNPLWSQAIFDLMSVRISLANLYSLYFVEQAPADLVDYAYATAHQPGAKNVPFALISGRLSTPDIRTRYYARLNVPTLTLFDRDPFANFDMLPHLLGENENWQEARIRPSQGMPHFEKLVQTTTALDHFWQR
ncbi:MAG: alpha/beta fold hydrolase [Chloroflexi bacterium]|nr:alpha/beta fold hydrolase [Chloroflexota bacterium]